MHIEIDPHAIIRAKERGANEKEIRKTVQSGQQFPAKKSRSEFREIFAYDNHWEGNYYRNKQLRVFAAGEPSGWYVITVIVEFF
jgi:hypothetical protein